MRQKKPINYYIIFLYMQSFINMSYTFVLLFSFILQAYDQARNTLYTVLSGVQCAPFWPFYLVKNEGAHYTQDMLTLGHIFCNMNLC